jgi:hypothetical protein
MDFRASTTSLTVLLFAEKGTGSSFLSITALVSHFNTSPRMVFLCIG